MVDFMFFGNEEVLTHSVRAISGLFSAVANLQVASEACNITITVGELDELAVVFKRGNDWTIQMRSDMCWIAGLDVCGTPYAAPLTLLLILFGVFTALYMLINCCSHVGVSYIACVVTVTAWSAAYLGFAVSYTCNACSSVENVIAHEVGHVLGMKHTSANISSAPFPIMWPVAHKGRGCLHDEDMKELSRLFPSQMITQSCVHVRPWHVALGWRHLVVFVALSFTCTLAYGVVMARKHHLYSQSLKC